LHLGTGKSICIIELILQLFFLDPECHLIVATPSNSAAYLLTDALVKSGKLNDSHDFIRFVSHNQAEMKLIPEHLKKYCATFATKSYQKARDEVKNCFDKINIGISIFFLF
jgi:RNA helicase armi